MVDRLSGRATWLVSRAHLRGHGILQELFSVAGSRPYCYRLLAALDEHGPAGQAALGRMTGLDPSDVSHALDSLGRDGHVTREPHPSDGRQKLVSITPDGRAELERLDRVLDAAQERFLAPLGAEERLLFLGLIARLGLDTSSSH